MYEGKDVEPVCGRRGMLIDTSLGSKVERRRRTSRDNPALTVSELGVI